MKQYGYCKIQNNVTKVNHLTMHSPKAPITKVPTFQSHNPNFLKSPTSFINYSSILSLNEWWHHKPTLKSLRGLHHVHTCCYPKHFNLNFQWSKKFGNLELRPIEFLSWVIFFMNNNTKFTKNINLTTKTYN